MMGDCLSIIWVNHLFLLKINNDINENIKIIIVFNIVLKKLVKIKELVGVRFVSLISIDFKGRR